MEYKTDVKVTICKTKLRHRLLIAFYILMGYDFTLVGIKVVGK